MAEYFVIKREKCEHPDIAYDHAFQRCGHCHRSRDEVGYIENQVNLLDVLARVRWNVRVLDEGVTLAQCFNDLTLDE